MTYLPAPYESAPSDDLAAALAGGLTVTSAGITAWILGSRTWTEVTTLLDRGWELDTLPTELVLVLGGWALGTVLLALGGVSMLFRRGRGLLAFGAIVSVAATIFGQSEFDFDQRIPQWPLYWGGVLVLVVLMLPATGRWVKRTARKQPPLMGTVTTGGAPF